MLSDAYFLAKILFDTAENEPAKKLQNFAKFANCVVPTSRPTLLQKMLTCRPQRAPPPPADVGVRSRRPTGKGKRFQEFKMISKIFKRIFE